MTQFILWGLTASPYQLKMQSLLDYAGHSWERWPDQAGRWSALTMAVRLQSAKRRGAVRRFPAMSAQFDEYPAVPFYTQDGDVFYYDSSALAHHLDDRQQLDHPPLVPRDSRMTFVCQLLDEAFDEFGLYMVHHMRWVTSARTTPMGDMTARELRALLPPGFTPLLASRLYHRQVSRCPYLFSVAPEGFDVGMSPLRTPPARAGFPPTHALLDEAWRRYVAAMESLLAQQPFLLGGRFTLADASAYGQLGMNMVDPEAAALLQELAPRTWRWLCAIRGGEHRSAKGELALTPALQPLMAVISETFIPLMRQNEAAYEVARARGETLFNEAAFARGRALYDGQLLGYPFRAVVKTFQVRVWREVQASWRALQAGDRDMLERDLYPTLRELNQP
ncbi:MAG: glutathione S-transferase C-terminal domain-containing protein [Haliea sp.]|nr:glutathione S-transferase C-terminal domain-containing protein [Haliea sp.]